MELLIIGAGAVPLIVLFLNALAYHNQLREQQEKRYRQLVFKRLNLYFEPCRVCKQGKVRADNPYLKEYSNHAECERCETKYEFSTETLEWQSRRMWPKADMEKRIKEYDFAQKCTAEFERNSIVIEWEYDYPGNKYKGRKREKSRLLLADSPLPNWGGAKSVKIYTNGYKVLPSPWNHCTVIESQPRKDSYR